LLFRQKADFNLIYDVWHKLVASFIKGIGFMNVKINGSGKAVSKEAAAGAAVYSKFLLSIYDIEVLMFNSISAMNFLHCLPGTMLSKEAAIKNLVPFLNEGGVFFGVTVLGEGVDVGILYRKANSVYNKKTIFSNLHDNASDLELVLSRYFQNYSVHVVGSVAFFTGQN
jgi:hypothetical protein